MNCINLKQKLNRTLYCKYKKCDINISECNNCKFKQYKSNNNQTNKLSANLQRKTKNTLRIKNKSNELAKLERKRFSLFSDNINKCYLCPSTHNLTWHEIYQGRNRQNSMKYGLCLRLCLNCHETKQEDKEFNDYWHKKGQAMFNDAYPDLIFLDIFKRNYL